MSEKILLRFNGSHSRYVVGDVAGFSRYQADRICGKKITQVDRDGNHTGREIPLAVPLTKAEVRELRKPKEDVLPEILRPVLFTDRFGPYAPGDIAGFPSELYKKLVEGYRARHGKIISPVAIPYTPGEVKELSGEQFTPAPKPRKRNPARKKSPRKKRKAKRSPGGASG